MTTNHDIETEEVQLPESHRWAIPLLLDALRSGATKDERRCTMASLEATILDWCDHDATTIGALGRGDLDLAARHLHRAGLARCEHWNKSLRLLVPDIIAEDIETITSALLRELLYATSLDDSMRRVRSIADLPDRIDVDTLLKKDPFFGNRLAVSESERDHDRLATIVKNELQRKLKAGALDVDLLLISWRGNAGVMFRAEPIEPAEPWTVRTWRLTPLDDGRPALFDDGLEEDLPTKLALHSFNAVPVYAYEDNRGCFDLNNSYPRWLREARNEVFAEARRG